MYPTSEEFNDLVEWIDGLPRPKWQSLWTRYCGGEKADSEAELHLQRLWLAELRGALGGAYGVSESNRFLLLREHATSEGEIEERLAELERMLDRVLDALDGIGPPGGKLPGKLPVLYFSEADDYYAYIDDYYENDGHFAGSGGICLRRDEVHIAVNGGEKLREVALVHELVHACLAHLTLPMWLEEGIVAIVEHVAVEGLSPDKPRVDALSRAQRDAQGSFWGPIGLQSYWSGEAFFAPDDASPLSYELAEVMVRAIHAGRPDAFDAFVRQASPDDAGESAAVEVLGTTLVAVVRHCIGDGPWLPPLGTVRRT
jgi:hypothetical protein